MNPRDEPVSTTVQPPADSCHFLVPRGRALDGGEVQVLENLRVLTAPAEYGQPRIERVFPVEQLANSPRLPGLLNRIRANSLLRPVLSADRPSSSPGAPKWPAVGQD